VSLGFLSLGSSFALGGLGACGPTVASSEPQLPPQQRPAAQPPNSGVLEPVREPIERKPERESKRERTPKPTTVSAVGLSTASCGAFDPAQLVAVAGDQDCDAATPQACPQGSHIDWVPGSPCASCVVDSPENRTCAWATACFEPFIESIAHASGAKSCQRDRDCSVLTVAAGCGPQLSLALNGLINEELPMIAELYATQNCSLCPDAPAPSADLLKVPVRCVEGVCR